VLPVETRLAASPAKANGDGATRSSPRFADNALGGCRRPLGLLGFSLGHRKPSCPPRFKIRKALTGACSIPENAGNESQSEALDRTELLFRAGAIRRSRACRVGPAQPLGSFSRAATSPLCAFAGG